MNKQQSNYDSSCDSRPTIEGIVGVAGLENHWYRRVHGRGRGPGWGPGGRQGYMGALVGPYCTTRTALLGAGRFAGQGLRGTDRAR